MLFSSRFIVNMHYAFQDKEYIYLIMDYLGGGDLRYHIIRNYKFSESKTSKNIFLFDEIKLQFLIKNVWKTSFFNLMYN